MTERHRIAVVAHDAGGANVLTALACKYRDRFDWHFAVAGPALSIAGQAGFADIHPVAGSRAGKLATLFETMGADVVLTGSGWASDVERDGIRAARRCRRPVLTYLDHWVNYRERFAPGDDWRGGLPDVVLVGDGYAMDLALRNGFPAERLAPVENPYLSQCFACPAAVTPPSGECRGPRLLFLSEPVGAAPFAMRPAGGGLETRIVAVLIEALGRSGAENARLSIRLHPSEAPDKYDALVGRGGEAAVLRRIEIHPAATRSLIDDCAQADRVVGIASMALLVAAALGRPTYSYRGDDGAVPPLPQDGIAHLASAAALAELLCVSGPTAVGGPFDPRLFDEPFAPFLERFLAGRYESCR